MKKCPYCAEEILQEAIKCKHCGEFIKLQKEVKKNKSKLSFEEKLSSSNNDEFEEEEIEEENLSFEERMSSPSKNQNISQSQKTHTLGLVAFIITLIGLFTSFIFPFFFQIFGVTLGHVALRDYNKNKEKYSGKGIIIASLIINYIIISLAILTIFVTSAFNNIIDGIISNAIDALINSLISS